MYSWVRLSHLLQWSQGRASGAWTDLPVASIGTDSRAVKRGEVFLALKGESFDGHEFIDKAIAQGAAAVISAKEVSASVPVIVVDDTLKAFVRIAAALRDRFEGRVFAITGSAGKSSTKEMVATLLGPDTLRSPASFNNLIGASKTWCLVEDSTKRVVMEIGMNASGELTELCETFRPEGVMITNIGDAHMGKLGGKQGVYAAKKEVFDYLAKQASPPVGVALNVDDPLVQKAYHEAFGQKAPRTLRYSVAGRPADVTILEKKIDPVTASLVVKVEIAGNVSQHSLALFGLHHAQNLAAGLTAALLMGAERNELSGRFANIRPAYHRGEILMLAGGKLLIDESYNSNPTALTSALTSLSELDPSRRRVLILGEMREMGEFTEAVHVQAGETIVNLQRAKRFPMIVIGVGEGTRALVRVVRESLPEITALELAGQQDVLPRLKTLLAPNDIVFVKGSRGNQLDKVVDALAK